MVIVMPDAGQFAAFEDGLTAERLDAILAGLRPAIIDLTMPIQAGEKVTIDRPFLFLIRDRETETILFMGRVVDPRG